MLDIKTLGQFNILLDGVSLLDGKDAKRGLLLVYLAEQRKPLPRLDLARMLWPEVDDNTAQVNMRSLLLRLRREGLEPFLNTGRSTVELVSWHAINYDVAQFRTLTTRVREAQFSDLMSAAALYTGAFLQAVVLDEYPQLDEWAGSVRAEMELRAVQMLSRLVAQAIASGQAEAVLHYAEDLVALTPYEDESQALYIQALSAVGRVSDALNYFHKYRRLLKEEMQVDVGRELAELVAHLSRPRLLQTAATKSSSNAHAEALLSAEERTSTEHYFPYIEHPIIGRTRETDQLIARLDSGSRLVTVVGIGGTGKTFFVRSQYERLRERFGEEIYYADLRNDAIPPDRAVDALLLSIAAAVNITPQPGRPILVQIISALHGRKSCLILDNFETVQTATGGVQELLQAAPQLTILATSRERLGLSSESVLMLGGLNQNAEKSDVGDDPGPTTPAWEQDNREFDSEAIRYFFQCLQRHDPGYQLNAESRSWIEQICREVEGLPLAIELTAMQSPFYSLAELARRITKDVSILNGTVGDLPGDHYSVWAVLENMWQTLDDDKRRLLTELSTFAGPFHRDAMMVVSPAPRSAYTGLINTSLLRMEEPAWFSLHPLVRQFAAQRLAPDSAAPERHAHYFLKWFEGGGRLRENARPPLPPPLAIRCQADVVAAWQWAVVHAAWDLLDESALEFCRYLLHTQQQEETNRLMSLLVEHLPPPEECNEVHYRVAGRAAFFLGVRYHILPGDTSVKWFERSLLWLQAANASWDVAGCALTFLDIMLGTGVGTWERVKSVMALATNLIETNQFEPLRIPLDVSRCGYYLRLGAWTQMRDTQASLISRIPRFVDNSLVTVQLWNYAMLGDWSLLARFIDRVEADNLGTLASPWVNQWTGHYRSYLLIEKGDVQGAVAQRLAILANYEKTSLSILAPMVHAELALWQSILGDRAAAQTSAVTAYSIIQQAPSAKSTAYGLLDITVVQWLSGDTAAAVSLLRQVLALGRKLYDLVMIFSSIYYLARIHADKLPPDLFQRIIKTGAVSPVMHFVLRPLARAYLLSQGIEIREDERDLLWATNAEDVDALVTALEEKIGKQ